MNQKFNLFTEISKTEEQSDGTLKVMGYASSEAKDAQGEIVKSAAIAAAIPEFMKYGTGNLREMHQPIAAGTVPFLKVLEDGRTEIHAHVVDEGTVKKVKAGVLKGFSIGGSATERDGKDKSVIKGVKLSEISLVDRPANPEAVVTFFKIEDAMTPEPNAAVTAVDELAKMLNEGVDPARLLELAKADAAAKAPEGGKAADAAGATDADMQKLADELGVRSLHSLHLALAEGTEGLTKAALSDAMIAIGDEATKGDFPGHPFRGNQFTGGASGGSSSSAVHSSMKAKAAEKAGGKGAKSAHKEAAKAHKAAAKELKASGKGDSKSAQYHAKMAEFHASAAGTSKAEDGEDLQKGEAMTALKKYAGQEIDDASQAMDALRSIRWVLSSELSELEDEPEQVQNLLDAIDKLKAFIQSELDEDTLMQGKADKAGALQKLHAAAKAGADNRLAKAVEDMAKGMADLRREVSAKDEKIEALTKMIGSMPTSPKGGGLFVVSRGGAVEDELVVKNADGTVDQVATAAAQIRKARQDAGYSA